MSEKKIQRCQGRGQGTWRFVVASLAVALVSGGCSSHPSDQQIQQQAAQTTEQVKQDAQQAAANARVAAANAEEKIDAVAAGVKQGLKNGPSGPVVDLNSATPDQLVSLPGVTGAKARRIIAGRPYSAPSDLVTRNLMTQSQYDRISGRVTAKPPST